MGEIPTAEDVALLADLDEFNKRINGAVTWLTETKGYDRIIASWLLDQHATNAQTGKRMALLVASAALDADDGRNETRAQLAQTLHEGGALISDDRETLKKRLSAWRLAADKRTGDPEINVETMLKATEQIRRLDELGFIGSPVKSDGLP